MLVAPVRVGDQTIGVISADQDEFDWFSESDRRLLDALAWQAGIAIERATALELLQDIGNRIISAQNVGDILQQIVCGAIKLTNTTSGVIYLISEDGKSVINSFQYPPDFDHPAPRMDEKGGLTRQVFATGKTLIFPDIRQDARVNPVLHDRVQSMIAIPLKLEQKVIGVLYLNDADLHDFTETEISLLRTLASQAAIAIENARLYTELGRERLELRSRLINAERLLVASRFAVSYIHRVNNLVGTIPIRVMQIKEKLADTPDVLRMLEPYLDGVLDDARRVSPITEELTELTREEPKRELVDVVDALARVARRVRIETPAEIGLDENYPEESVWVRAVAWELSDAFWNVLKNGVEAMLPDGGLLSLSVAKVSDEVGRMFAEIRIHNAGPKIPKEILQQILSPSAQPRVA